MSIAVSLPRVLPALLLLLGSSALFAPERATAREHGEAPGGGDPANLPRTPHGLAACESPLVAAGAFTPRSGEVITYDVEVMGLDVGTLEFAVGRRGSFKGEPVTEYRSALKVAALVPLEGNAASLMADTTMKTLQSSQRYRWASMKASEMQTFFSGGTEVASRRMSNDEPSETRRKFATPVQDFLSGFYSLRRLSRDQRGCAIFYSNHKAYTAWISPDGEELVKTPYGKRMADRVKVRYASDEAKVVREAVLWVSQDDRRVPYKAEGLNPYSPRAVLKTYSAP